ncbi:DUF4148 domain-containing protein [Paraburkholderia sp.]|uniref:DUF4148 domain-containing protein n=1 Tax=Paraburkholderia sp. TaxID=1926495 RepID=UPI003D6F5FB5
MKTLIAIALTLGACTASITSFASTTAPLTRAQVYADLVRVEQAGYVPSAGDDENYPEDIQAAEAKIAATDAASRNAQATLDTQRAVGGTSVEGTSQAGSPSQ